MDPVATNGGPDHIDTGTGQRLLRLARAALREHLSGQVEETPEGDALEDLEPRGVFVTLRREGRLRGCIGTFQPLGSIPETVFEMAVASANDPRFVGTPISMTELPDLRIELSILSPLREISEPLDFQRGVHGILIERGLARGCFLPDVGMDLGWDKETFLSELCSQKAGLSPTAWRDGTCRMFTFTVQKFVE